MLMGSFDRNNSRRVVSPSLFARFYIFGSNKRARMLLPEAIVEPVERRRSELDRRRARLFSIVIQAQYLRVLAPSTHFRYFFISSAHGQLLLFFLNSRYCPTDKLFSLYRSRRFVIFVQ